MRKFILIGLCLAGVPSLSWAAALTPAQQAAQDAAVKKAFSDARILANGTVGGASASITNGTVQRTVNSFNPTYYSYSNTAPETALFMSGNGDTFTAGTAKITACQTGAANQDAFRQQNCDAISYMARNPSTRPQFTISPTDPNIAASRAIEKNASTLAAKSLGFVNPNAVGSFMGCASKTTTTPPTYGIEVCYDAATATSQMCTIGRTVVVNANTNYQCDKTANAYQTQTCNKTLNVVVTPTPYCSVSGSATGLGSYKKAITKRVYSPALRKWVYTTTTSIISYPHFNVIFGCSGDALARVAVTISASSQCHWGGCNSDYYPITLNFISGTNAGPVSLNMARTYDGIWWETSTVSYNGATNTVTITTRVNRGRGGLVTVTASAVPSGTVGIRNSITSSWVNGCATQQAAAL